MNDAMQKENKLAAAAAIARFEVQLYPFLQDIDPLTHAAAAPSGTKLTRAWQRRKSGLAPDLI
jgi:hypothetical protein